MARPDPRELLAREPLVAAPFLLGAELRVGTAAVRLTEVEAYGGADDPGSHAHRGRTPRNASMFERPGVLYVYLVYGMHHCANVAVGPEGRGGALLLRAGEVVTGLAEVRERRGSGVPDRDLARGPGRLCAALGIDRGQDGWDLLGEGPGPRLVLPGGAPGGDRLRSGPRVGLRAAPERPWRFWLDGEPTVSSYRPAAPRRGREARG